MIPLLLILLGLVLGSFVNALVWRLHNNKDWVRGRSECSHCHHELSALDLVPVLSWVILRGKCRYCNKKIEDSPLVELTLPMLFLLSYFLWPVEFAGNGLIQFVFWLVFLTVFLALAVYDLKWYLLPNKLVFLLIGLAVIQVAVTAIYSADWHVLADAAAGALVVSGIFYALFELSKGTWIGGGDVKLGIVLGLLAGGLFEGFLLLFVSSVIGMLVSLPLILQGKAHRKTQLPFGPLLIAGLIIVVLFGTQIIDWYSGLFYVG